MEEKSHLIGESDFLYENLVCLMILLKIFSPFVWNKSLSNFKNLILVEKNFGELAVYLETEW